MMKKLQILSLDRDSDTSIAQVPTVISSENRVEEKGGGGHDDTPKSFAHVTKCNSSKINTECSVYSFINRPVF